MVPLPIRNEPMQRPTITAKNTPPHTTTVQMAAFPAFPAFPAFNQQCMLPGDDPLYALADLDDIFDQEEFDNMMDGICMDFTADDQPSACAPQMPAYETAPAYTGFGDLTSSANTMLFAMLEQRASLFSPQQQFQLPLVADPLPQHQNEYSTYAPTPYSNAPGSVNDEDYTAERSSTSSAMPHGCADCGKTFTCASKVSPIAFFCYCADCCFLAQAPRCGT